MRLNAPFAEETIKEMIEITRKHDATIRKEENDRVLTALVQELAGTWRMRDTKLFDIIRAYRTTPIGAMKAESLRNTGEKR